MHFGNKLSLAVQYFLQDRCKFINRYIRVSVGPCPDCGKSNLMIQSQVKIYIYIGFHFWIGYTWGSSRRSLEFAEMKRSHAERLSERLRDLIVDVQRLFLHTNKVWERTAVAHDQKPVPVSDGRVMTSSDDSSYSVSITFVYLYVCVRPPSKRISPEHNFCHKTRVTFEGSFRHLKDFTFETPTESSMLFRIVGVKQLKPSFRSPTWSPRCSECFF